MVSSVTTMKVPVARVAVMVTSVAMTTNTCRVALVATVVFALVHESSWYLGNGKTCMQTSKTHKHFYTIKSALYEYFFDCI